MAERVIQPRKQYTSITASGAILAGPGRIYGIFVSSSTAGTLKLWDSLSAAGTVIADTTAAITAPVHYPIELRFTTGLFITVGGTTISCTIIWAPDE